MNEPAMAAYAAMSERRNRRSSRRPTMSVEKEMRKLVASIANNMT